MNKKEARDLFDDEFCGDETVCDIWNNLFEISDKIVADSEKEIQQLLKEVEYWKKSFNKQVQSSRGGYQPIKNNDGEPLPPPGAE